MAVDRGEAHDAISRRQFCRRPTMSVSVPMSDNMPSPSRRTLEHLLPDHISRLLDDRPLLWFEDSEHYDALLAELIGAYDPKETLQFFLIKDLADAQWDMTRQRELRQAAIEWALPDVALNALEKDFRAANDLDYNDARDELRLMIRKAAQGDANMRKALDHYCAEAGVTYRMMQYQAFRNQMKSLKSIEDNLARAERRRDQMIRMIEDRRRNIAAMSRSLVDRAGATPAIEATAPASDEAA
jgi:hypothetical protein